MKCCHCQKQNANRPCGLCWSCYYKPGVRQLYPLTSKYTRRGVEDYYGKAKLPGSQFPRIVCLCGSTRFFRHYQEAEYNETMAGNIYLSIGFFPGVSSESHGEGVGISIAEKVALDELHKRKIDLADEVFVINVGGYIGDSTKSEVCYALKTGKPIRWLEPELAWSPDTED